MVHYGKWCQALQHDPPRDGWEEVRQMASITISPIELRRLSDPDAVEPSELREMTQTAEFLADHAEKHWERMPPKIREALIALVYSMMNPPQNLLRKYSAALRGGLWYTRIRLKGEQEAFSDFVIAHRRMTNAILEAVERDNSAYQQALSEVIEEAFSDLEHSEALTPEDTLEQLRQLSDEACREIQ